MIGFLSFLLALQTALAQNGPDVTGIAQAADLPVPQSTFAIDNLNCHNTHRSMHQVTALQSNNKLQTAAQRYADALASRDNGLVHDTQSEYGENLYMSYGMNVDGNTACNAWYQENQKYKYNKNNPPNFNQVGHFTQMVWKDTANIGIGVASSKSGKTYVVAKYSPPGNYKGQYRNNVLPPAS